MKQTAVPGKLFRLEPNGHWEKYDGKTVEFIFDLDGRLLLLTGQFVTYYGREFECVDIHYAGRLDPQDPPYAYYVFHLSRAHLRSTVAASKPGATVDFLMERPLVARGCVRGTFEDWKVPSPISAVGETEGSAAATEFHATCEHFRCYGHTFL
jgi:hypothetical protein